MACHTHCGHDHACHQNCNCPWKEKQALCEKLEVVVTCMKDGGSHSTCPHLDEETKTQLMQEPWSLAKDIANHVADYLLPQEKEASHEDIKNCHMKCGWDRECHHKCPGHHHWKKMKEERDTLNQASVCHHACEQSETKCPFKKTECHFKCPMSMPSSVQELKGLTDHVLCHTTCGHDKTCHSTCPNSNWDEKKAKCEKFQEISACHKLCGRDHACHHKCPHGEWHHGHHELANASAASAVTVQEVVDNLFDKYLPQKATWEEVKACHAKCNKDEACLSACPKHECPFQRISAQCDLFNSSMAAAKECHQACRHNFACHFKCPMATPTSMKELKAVGEAMTCHNQCGHDHTCHKNCNCPWKEKQARCEKLEAVVTCMRNGGSHTTCPHLDEETKTRLMQEPWSLAKDIANHVVDYLLPHEKEVSHEETKTRLMQEPWSLAKDIA